MILMHERQGMPAMVSIPDGQSWSLRAVLGDRGYELLLLVQGEVLDVVLEAQNAPGDDADIVDWLYVLSMIIRKSANAMEFAEDKTFIDLTDVIRSELSFWHSVSQMV